MVSTMFDTMTVAVVAILGVGRRLQAMRVTGSG